MGFLASSALPSRRPRGGDAFAGSVAFAGKDANSADASRRGCSAYRGRARWRRCDMRLRAAEGDFYRALDVDRKASLGELKAAYRTAVRRCHPDVDASEEAQARFQVVSKAYEVLSDPRLRGVYDTCGSSGVQSILDGTPLTPLNGHKRWVGKPSKGEDIRVILPLLLEESVLGCKKKVEFKCSSNCPVCEGSGYHPHAHPERCNLCRGSGTVARNRQLSDGSSPTTICACPDCGGSGTLTEQYCTACRGAGLAPDSRSLGVSIPPGVASGHWIKYRGKGSAGAYSGDPGDLYIGVQTQAHASIRRCGSDLYSMLELPFTDAILGGATSVTTIWEVDCELIIPPCTQHGAVITLPGAGAPLLNGDATAGSRGAHHFHVVILLPTPATTTSEERQLLLEIHKLRGGLC